MFAIQLLQRGQTLTGPYRCTRGAYYLQCWIPMCRGPVQYSDGLLLWGPLLRAADRVSQLQYLRLMRHVLPGKPLDPERVSTMPGPTCYILVNCAIADVPPFLCQYSSNAANQYCGTLQYSARG